MPSRYEPELSDPTSSAYKKSCWHGADADCSTCYGHRLVALRKRACKKQPRPPSRPTGLAVRDCRYATPYQALGNGATEPFDAAPISVNMLSTQLMPLFQKYTTAQHLNDLGRLLFPARRPLSLDFLQELISDEGALHSIYAWLYSVHALMRPGCGHAEQSKVMSRFHHGQALARANTQLQHPDAAALYSVVLLVINSIYYCLNYLEYEAALIHYEGLKHIVKELGGLDNIGILGKLHILIAVWFTSRELLVRPLFPVSKWPWMPFFEDSSVSRCAHVFKTHDVPAARYMLEAHPAIRPILWELVTAHQECMSVLGQYKRLKGTCSVDLQPVLAWICLREHVIGLMSMDVYCSIRDMTPKLSSFDAAFGQVFALTTLTCQNAVHSVFRNTGAFWFVPFYKLRGPLKSLVDRSEDLEKAHEPLYRNAFLWMLFVLATEQHYTITHAAAGIKLDTTTPAWASLQLQRVLHVCGITMIHDLKVRFEAVRSILQGFLWDEDILGPLLKSMLKMCARLGCGASEGDITSTNIPSYQSWLVEQEEAASGNDNRTGSRNSIPALESCAHSKATAMDVKRMIMGTDVSQAYRSKHDTIFAPDYPPSSEMSNTTKDSTSFDSTSAAQRISPQLTEAERSYLSTKSNTKSTKGRNIGGSFATIKFKPPLKWRREAQLGPNHFNFS